MAKWWLGAALTVAGMTVASPAPGQFVFPDGAEGPGLAPANYLPPAGAPAGAPPGQPSQPGLAPPPGMPGGFGPDFVPPGPGMGGPDNAFPAPDCCPHCNARERFHVDADYLLWFTRTHNLPILVTSGSPFSPAPGALGQTGTQSLLDNSSLSNPVQSGVRLTLAMDLGSSDVWSVEASGFILDEKTASASFTGNGRPGTNVLARPFFNADVGAESAAPFAFPGLMAGSLGIDTNQRFYGADANVRYLYWRSTGQASRIDLLAGANFLALDERLSFDQTTVGGSGLVALSEGFKTSNRFYGGQVGVAYEGRIGGAFLDLLGKFALGENVQTLTTDAVTTIISPAGGVVAIPNRGLFVQPSNAGRFTHSQFAFVPQLGLTLGYEFNQYVRLGAGYNLIIWTNVIRPEGQIDHSVNLLQHNPAADHPMVNFQDTTFWAQGLTLSLQLSF